MNLTLFYKDQFNDALVKWFRRTQRPMPWRLTKDPYAIMVSEFMLQQTQVVTVIPYYIRFIQRFPTAHELAIASEEDVLRLWAGLGYYSRARHLQRACQQIMHDFHGRFPSDYEQIRSLQGVGDYTAGAIRSIAFDLPTPAVDGNVMRVFSRITESRDDIGLEKTKQMWRQSIAQWMDIHHASDYTQGLMELGAVICTPKNPQCSLCPVKEFCTAFTNQSVSDYPVKNKKVKVTETFYDVLLITNGQGQVVIEQRPASGLLALQWQLPMVERDGIPLEQVDYRHQFSHRLWHLRLQSISNPNYPLDSHQKWDDITNVKMSIITAHQRLLQLK